MPEHRSDHKRSLSRLRALVGVATQSSERLRDGARRTRDGRLQQILMSAADLASRHAEELSVSLRNSSGHITTSVPIPWLDDAPSATTRFPESPRRVLAEIIAHVDEVTVSYREAIEHLPECETRSMLDRQLSQIGALRFRLEALMAT